MKSVTATEFKNNALKLLKQVRETGESVQITSRGKPVGRLCPEGLLPRKRVFGASRGLATITGDIVGSIVDHADFVDSAI
jgi:prevent-host-death family protein